jgi:FkbM family methyltransferase
MAQRCGIDLQRYPEADPMHQIVKLLHWRGVDLVIDVGANDGGYAISIRRHGYGGRILSFEPLPEPYRKLRAHAAKDGDWDTMQYAIGAERGRVTVNIAGNSGASSSVLPMLERHRQTVPESAYIGREEAEVHPLDDLVTTTRHNLEENLYLKVDVQGYERAVLTGAADLFISQRVVGLQMEMSFTPLYEGAMTWREGFDFAADRGMTLMGLYPGFTDKRTGQMLQADGVFYRI